jgi:hypothetical protein
MSSGSLIADASPHRNEPGLEPKHVIAPLNASAEEMTALLRLVDRR